MGELCLELLALLPERLDQPGWGCVVAGAVALLERRELGEQATREILLEEIVDDDVAERLGLREAFANIYATMDSIDQFKLKALDTMSLTIGTLETEVAKSRDYLDRVAQQDTRAATLPAISIDK